MEVYASVRERPDVSAQERASHELLMRVLKLRWMGLENEAHQMETVLHRVDPACTLLAGPFDTD
jgi:hypothetical protein